MWKTENDQTVANNTTSIVELFNSFFASIFTNHIPNHEMTSTDTADFNESSPQILDEIKFSALEVSLEVLIQIKRKKRTISKF